MFIRFLSVAAVAVLLALLGSCSSAPRYQGMDADQLYELGVREFESGDWDEAVRVFERLIFSDPTYSRMVESRLFLARAYFNKEEYITAVSEFTRILDRHPGHALAPEASLGVCRAFVELSPIVQRDQEYTVQALNACGNVVADFGASEVSLEAQTLLDQMVEKLARKVLSTGDYYFRRKYFDSALIYFNLLLEDYPRTEAASWALLRLYQSYSEIQWETEAEEARDRLLSEFPDSEAAREVRTAGDGPGSGQGSPGSASAAGAENAGHRTREGT
ncbi:outer membrane protein assembly factor BamD [Gemmatimonadota bacterium]